MGIRKLLTAAIAMIGLFAVLGGAASAASAGPASGPDIAVSGDNQAGVAAVTPTIWPPAERVRYWDEGSNACPYLRLCVDVWDPTVKNFKIFDLYKCGPYRLSNWHNHGTFINNQTAGTVGRFLDRNGREVQNTGPAWGWGGLEWEPIWSIKAC